LVLLDDGVFMSSLSLSFSFLCDQDSTALYYLAYVRDAVLYVFFSFSFRFSNYLLFHDMIMI